MADDARDLTTLGARPSSSDRETAIARLSDAFAHDVLSLEEFEVRATSVYRAATMSELARLLADLPSTNAGVRPPASASSNVAVVVPRRISAIFSNIEREGPIDVPAHLDLRCYFGNMELDLSTARFASGVTDISIRVFCGNVEVRVPANAVVENNGDAILASFRSQVPEPSGEMLKAPGVRLRITGRAILGNVEIDPAPAELPVFPPNDAQENK